MEHAIDNREQALEVENYGSLDCPKILCTSVHKWLK